MLVLSRKFGEVVRVGRDIRVQVCDLDQVRVRLGIDAPGHMRVDREEIGRLITANGESADPAADALDRLLLRVHQLTEELLLEGDMHRWAFLKTAMNDYENAKGTL